MRSSVPHLCIIPSLFVPVHPYSMNTTQTDHVSDHPASCTWAETGFHCTCWQKLQS